MEWLDSFWATYSTLVLSVGTNALLALSIYLTLATGLLTVGNAAFMGIGAYTAAWLTTQTATPFWSRSLLGAALPARWLSPSAGRLSAFREFIWRWRLSPSAKSCAS